MNRRARIIAYYLPQYHPVAENDQWWGKGFTEWTNVAKAKPLYPGHYQPHIPADLGFYDLRLPEAREAQAEMAQDYGVYGFCYYHYWFAGRKVLERPFEEVLASRTPNFPFCLCWANHSWSGTWQGKSNLVFLEQTYPSLADHRRHFDYLLPAFRDERYVAVDGKPLFLIWRPEKLIDPKATLNFWRELAHAAGLPGLFLVGINHHTNWLPQELGLDAATREAMPPKNGAISPRLRRLWFQKHVLRRALPTVYAYEDMVEYVLRPSRSRSESYPTVIPNWDNSPRFGNNSLIFEGSNPELFRRQLRLALSKVESYDPDHRIIFLKAWNEWAEGNYVEPDLRFGRGYLEAIRSEILADGHGEDSSQVWPQAKEK